MRDALLAAAAGTSAAGALDTGALAGSWGADTPAGPCVVLWTALPAAAAVDPAEGATEDTAEEATEDTASVAA